MGDVDVCRRVVGPGDPVHTARDLALRLRRFDHAPAGIINGFCKDVFQMLPDEFAAEAGQLLGLKLEGAVG